MSEASEQMFIWLAPNRTTRWSIQIGPDSSNLTDISDYVLSAKFSRSVFGEEMSCAIELDNSGETYTSAFLVGYEIYFYMDFSDGTTVQWRGKLEKIENKLNDSGFILNILGSHVTADSLDITVTEEFSGTAASTVLTSLVSEYLTGYTTTNVETVSTSINIVWKNKPLFDCIVDLMKLADADCYVDNNKDFHFFTKNTKENANEAVVWDDSLIELRNLGSDAVDVRNKIIVYGESGGLPVIHTSTDSSSQTTYGVKERVIEDSSIVDETSAEEFGDAEIDNQKNPPTKGDAECLFMPSLNPGDSLWVVSPPHAVQSTFRLVKYTFRVPEERTDVIFSQEVSISQLLKDRIKKDLSQEKITNPYKMQYSYNFTFDDFSKINESASNDITVSNGKLVADGTNPIMISQIKILPISASQAHLLVTGEILTDATFEISADGTDTYQTISIDTLTTITTPGTQLKIKVTYASASDVQIDSMALLVK